ncbi:hypothetical protein [Streptomyces sp. NPDC020362]|uniref:hypothetical protein n=1 Tax=Streptomyces sp. NPDC020362 TaxID=3154486 RepID=UPI000AC1AC34
MVIAPGTLRGLLFTALMVDWAPCTLRSGNDVPSAETNDRHLNRSSKDGGPAGFDQARQPR